MRLLSALILTSFCCSTLALASDKCEYTYRPTINEIAFAPVGQALKVVDRNCTKNLLSIPKTQKAEAVTLEQGEYELIDRTDNTLIFSTLSLNNKAKITSCTICDPLGHVEIDIDKLSTICVRSKLNVKSCALNNSIAYKLESKNFLTENMCTDALVYRGRDNDTLLFTYRDCKSDKSIALSYDLNYGSTIRFLNDQYEILSANNTGVYFKRLRTPPTKDNEIIINTENLEE